METRLNPNQISGGIGGSWGLFIKDYKCYLKFLKNIRGNQNAEYYLEFELLKNGQEDVWIICLEDLLGIQITSGKITDFNFGARTQSPLDDLVYNREYRYKCVVNGTTRTWYSPDANGDWIQHVYSGTPCIFTDTGIDPTSTNEQYLNTAGNSEVQNADSLINLDFFTVINNNEKIFSFDSATKGTDYEVYGPVMLMNLL